MSKMTISQMEVVLLDRIKKAKLKLDKLQQKQKLQIGEIAFKYNLHQLDLHTLEFAFIKIANELRHEDQ